MIEVYTTSTCPNCKVLKGQLKKVGIEFIEKNTDEDSVAMSEMVAENLWSVPIIKYNDHFIKTFNIEIIKELIK